jgi:hypothetical protein
MTIRTDGPFRQGMRSSRCHRDSTHQDERNEVQLIEHKQRSSSLDTIRNALWAAFRRAFLIYFPAFPSRSHPSPRVSEFSAGVYFGPQFPYHDRYSESLPKRDSHTHTEVRK